MDIKTQTAVREIVKNNLTEILSNYFTKDIVRRISNEVLSGVEWDLGNMEEK
ncbi:MAG: hypothetical protein J6S83_02675 [Lachnospiraceae bacterium]|nr:hypothetical protein [Lachnospiraceae bacterium]